MRPAVSDDDRVALQSMRFASPSSAGLRPPQHMLVPRDAQQRTLTGSPAAGATCFGSGMMTSSDSAKLAVESMDQACPQLRILPPICKHLFVVFAP